MEVGTNRDHRVVDGVGECTEYHGDGMCSEFCDGDILLEKLVLGGVP